MTSPFEYSPPPPMPPLVTILEYPPPPLPVASFLNGPLLKSFRWWREGTFPTFNICLGLMPKFYLWQGKQNVKVILPWRFASLTHLRNQKTQPFWRTETLQCQEVSWADVLVSVFEIKIEFLNVIFHEKRLRSYL